MSLRRRLRIARRDGDRCWICQHQLRLDYDPSRPVGPTRIATIDHYVPLSRGGSNALSNLRLACGPCNWRRGNALPDDRPVTTAGGDR